MTAKEYLSQAYKLDKQADMILQKAAAMRNSLYGRGQNGESGKPAPSRDSLAKAITKVVDYERKADELIDRLVDMRIEIENAISEVPDPIQREVLERRYLLYQSWDGYYDTETGDYIKGIYERMKCSRRQMFRYYNEGLKFIENMALNGIEWH